MANWRHYPPTFSIRICGSRKYPRNWAHHFQVIPFPFDISHCVFNYLLNLWIFWAWVLMIFFFKNWNYIIFLQASFLLYSVLVLIMDPFFVSLKMSASVWFWDSFLIIFDIQNGLIQSLFFFFLTKFPDAVSTSFLSEELSGDRYSACIYLCSQKKRTSV